MCSINVCWITVPLLLTIGVINGQEPCEPELADNCFADVISNLFCQMTRVKSPECVKRNVTDLCNGMDDALRCTSDVIDTDCNVREGRDKFDMWLQGLRAVHYSLCGANKSILNSLLANPHCWSLASFLSCTTKAAQLDHVNDFLRTALDLQECNRLLVTTATCNVRATKTDDLRCASAADGISEVLHTFFSATNCGTICPKSAASIPSQGLSLLILAFFSFLFVLF